MNAHHPSPAAGNAGSGPHPGNRAGTGRRRAALIWAGCALALAGCAWLWSAVMERSPTAQGYISPLAIDNPMLAAGTLLQRRGYGVSVEKNLGGVNLAALPDGTLILADNSGQINAPQAEQLLAWVRRGNTVLLQPKWVALRFEERDRRKVIERGGTPRLRPLTEPDPLAGRLGVGLSYRTKLRANCSTAGALPPDDGGGDEDEDAEEKGQKPRRKEQRQLTCVTLPGGRYPLALDTGTEVLDSIRPGPAPLWSDLDAMSVRVYGEGRGHIVLVSDNYFNNQRLPRFDHAELLLSLIHI